MYGSRGLKSNLSAAANFERSMTYCPKTVLRARYVMHGRPINRELQTVKAEEVAIPELAAA